MARNIAIKKLFYAVKMNSLESARNVLDQAKKELQVANKIKEIVPEGKLSLTLIDEIITALSNGDISKAKGKYEKAEKGFSGHVIGHLERSLKEIEAVKGLPKDVPGQYRKKPVPLNNGNKSQDKVDDIQHLNDKTNGAQLPKPQNERQHKEDKDQAAKLRQSGRSENKDLEQTETYNNRSSASENNGKLERSKLASFRMRQNNPDIADLSDPNRPTKIAERFSELYDNEWTEAFEELIKNSRKESEAITILLSIVTEAYKFCTDAAEKQIKGITKHWNAIFEFGPDNYKNKVNDLKLSPSSKSPNYSKDGESLIIQYRKKIASKALQKLKEDFTDGKMKQMTGKANLSAKPKEFTMYVQKAVELTWWMCVQDPPIFLCPPTKDEVFDKNLYKAYTKTGTKPQFFVWPALRLHKEGGILIKGVVQFE